MKIRIRGNSIRLRLSRAEVETFHNQGKVSDFIQFSSDDQDRLYYYLERGEGNDLSVIHEEEAIGVIVPSLKAHRWATTDLVGLYQNISIDTQDFLRVIIEKDFRCLSDRPDEDDSDLFPHPDTGLKKC